MDVAPPPVRARVLRFVQENPGTSVAAVAREFRIDHSTATYHLRRLERNGHTVARSTGRIRAYYAMASGFCAYERVILPLIDRPEARRVLTVFLDGAPERAIDVAREADVSPETARWVIGRCAKTGVLERVAYGRYQLRCARQCLESALVGTSCKRFTHAIDNASASASYASPAMGLSGLSASAKKLHAAGARAHALDRRALGEGR